MKNGAAYTYEQKIAIIREHTGRHRTLKEIGEEYGISKSYLCYLLKQYREKGRKGIAATKYYSEEFKLSVVKRHYEEGATIAELVKETGIQHRMIKEWLSRYAKEGYAGLTTRKRGRPKAVEPTDKGLWDYPIHVRNFGCPYDNACAESFFSLLKNECITEPNPRPFKLQPN